MALVAAAMVLAPPWAGAAPSGPGVEARAVVASAPASPAAEGEFGAQINRLRASKGLSQLQVHGDLVSVARRWTDHMIADGHISHNDALGSQVPGAWTKLGENVGVGYDVAGLMDAFIASPSHYRNLVDPDWTHLGIGVRMTADGRMWTTHTFMALPSSPPPPAPPPVAVPPRSERPATAASGGAATPAGAGAVAAGQPSTTTTSEPPRPEPTAARVTAVLEPLRSLEAG